MTKYHAVMLDETGCEFGVDIEAQTKDAAIEALRDDYPESGIADITGPGEYMARARARYERLKDELDNDY